MLSHLKILRGLSWDELLQLRRFAWRRLNEEQLDQVAGSLTFTSVLALVPMLAIGFAIFTTFPLFHTLRAALEAYFIQNLMPKSISNTILGYVTGFASKATDLSAIGSVFLLVTSISMMNMIDSAFNRIWRVKTSAPWVQRILVYWAIITLGPILIGLSVTLTSKLYMVTTDVLGHTGMMGKLFYTFISMLFSSVAFTLLYIVVPNRSVDWADAAWGGVLAGMAFEIAKRGFAAFIASFPGYAIIYGALAAIPLFLVWLYLSWYITLVGAVLVASLPVVRYERWWHKSLPGEVFVDAVALLDVLYHAREHSELAIVDVSVLRSNTGLGYAEMASLLERMEDVGWVGRVKMDVPSRVKWGKRPSDAAGHWALLANPDHVRLADVYHLFVFDLRGAQEEQQEKQEKQAKPGIQATPEPKHMSLILQVEEAIEQGLQSSLSVFFNRLHRLPSV